MQTEMKDKELNGKMLVKTGFWYIVSNYITRATVFITMPLFTRVLTKTQYGDYAVYLNWQNILLILCGFEVYSTLNKARFDFTNEGELDSYISSALILTSLFSGILLCLYFLFKDTCNRFLMIDQKYVYIIFAYLFTFPAFAMFQAEHRIKYQYKQYFKTALFVNFCSTIAAIGLLFYLDTDRLTGRILGQFGVYILVGGILYYCFLHKSHNISMRFWKYAIRMGFPMLFAFLSSQLFLAIDIFVVKKMCSAEEVSYLSVSNSYGQIVLLLVDTLNRAWSPWLFDMLKINNYRSIHKALKMYLAFVSCCSFGAILIGPEVIYVLAGSGYVETLYILPAFVVSGVFLTLINHFSNIEVYYQKPEVSAVLTLFAGAINLGMDIWSVRIFGYQSVMISTIICQIILIWSHYFITKQMVKPRIIPAIHIFYLMIITFFMLLMAPVFYEHDEVRYLIIVMTLICVMGIGIVKRQTIKKMIEK